VELPPPQPASTSKHAIPTRPITFLAAFLRTPNVTPASPSMGNSAVYTGRPLSFRCCGIRDSVGAWVLTVRVTIPAPLTCAGENAHVLSAGRAPQLRLTMPDAVEATESA